jgi:membrane fusion protein (multidrug efflux system)
MFVDIQQAAADLLTLRRLLAGDGILPTRAEVRLTLPDGSEYPQAGSVEFAEAVVGVETGTVTLRARFPNPQGLLLPGMVVRARFAQAVDTNVFLVPQPAISRDPKGNATLWVVGPGNRAVQRTVRADRTQGQFWVVTDGLQPGDRVITQGLGRVQQAASRGRPGDARGGGGSPGVQVRPVSADTPQRVQAPGGEQGAGGQRAGRPAG